MGAALILPNEVEVNDKRQVVSSWKGMYFIRPSEKGRLGLSLFEGPLGIKKFANFFSYCNLPAICSNMDAIYNSKKSINFFSVSLVVLGMDIVDYAEAGK
jgi:hypothetical protein